MKGRILLAALLIASACRRAEPPPASTAELIRISPAAFAKEVVASPAPAVIVNIWASWCGPCREEMPALLAAAKAHPNAELRLLSVDEDRDKARAVAFLVEMGAARSWFKVGTDQELFAAFPSWAGTLPVTLIFRRGQLVETLEGMQDRQTFDESIRRAIE